MPINYKNLMTGNEYRVWELLGTIGANNREIALSLNFSLNSIGPILNSLYKKLEVSNRTEAAEAYIKQHRAIRMRDLRSDRAKIKAHVETGGAWNPGETT